MQISSHSTTYLQNGWVFKVSQPHQHFRQELILLLHGWSGDENSMDIFIRALPTNVWIISPRAPYALPDTGYSWTKSIPDFPQAQIEFIESASGLWQQISGWKNMLRIPDEITIHLVGFSQGGAMSLILSFLHGNQIGKIACLSGFLPDWGENLIINGSLINKPYLITHGTSDQIVPVERARMAQTILRSTGASVNYCETLGGHKLAAKCFIELKAFFA